MWSSVRFLLIARVAASTLPAIALLLIISSSLLFSQISPQVIYGEDDRRDLYQYDSELFQQLAKSTALLLDRSHLQQSTDDAAWYHLKTETVGKRYGLCREEAFWQQPSVGICSGFLVGEDVLVSAGHCFLNIDTCTETAIVFDYAYRAAGDDPTRVPLHNVYFCKEILERVYEISEGLDFAVFRLDRKVQGRTALALRREGAVTKGTAVTVIGHPLGLPTKISHGRIRSTRDDDYFVITADLWTGSSGSPVFDANTGIVEGLVARGEEDFVVARGDNCLISKVCTADECNGEDVIRAPMFEDFVIPHL